MAKTESDPVGITRDNLVAAARDMAPMLRERAEQAEKDRRISDEVFAELRARGFFRILQPRRSADSNLSRPLRRASFWNYPLPARQRVGSQAAQFLINGSRDNFQSNAKRKSGPIARTS